MEPGDKHSDVSITVVPEAFRHVQILILVADYQKLERMGSVQVLRQSSEGVFVPLTVGGGIRDLQDASGKTYTALEVAGEYFRSGADKVGCPWLFYRLLVDRLDSLGCRKETEQ